jgi:hypothetical protein
MSAKVESIPRGATRHLGSIAWWMAGAVGMLLIVAVAGSTLMGQGSDTTGNGAGGGEVAVAEAGAQLTPQLTAMARAGVAPSLLAGMESGILRARAYNPAHGSAPDPGTRPQVKGGGSSGGAFQGTMGTRTSPNDAGSLCQAC